MKSNPTLLAGAKFCFSLILGMIFQSIALGTPLVIDGSLGQFANYSALAQSAAIPPSSINDGTATLRVSPGTAPLWSTASYPGPGSEINFQQRGGPATSPSEAFTQGTYIEIALDTTPHASDWLQLESISVTLRRNGAGAPNNFQFAYAADGDWDNSDLLGAPTNNTSTIAFSLTHSPGSTFTAADRDPRIRLYYWDTDGTLSTAGNTHLTKVTTAYSLATEPAGGDPDGSTETTPPNPTTRPNILIILADDMGYSDIGCYGSEIQTPHLDSLASRGIRFTNFYNHAKCNPTRAALMSGAYAQTRPGYGNDLAQRLTDAGYASLFVGKNHSSGADTSFRMRYAMDGGAENHFNPGVQRPGESAIPARQPGLTEPANNWTIDNIPVDVKSGAYTFPPNFYSSVTFADKAIEYLDAHVENDEPFFLYLSFTAPHWPIHALPEDKALYTGVYDVGWDVIRARRFDRQKKLGLFPPEAQLSPQLPGQRDWRSLSDAQKSDYANRMATHAAMVHRIDRETGRILNYLRTMGRLDNTIIVFLSDNGASPETYGGNNTNTDPDLTSPDTTAQTSFMALGREWTNATNAPFRLHKSTVYEGGARTPGILVWPGVIPDTLHGTWSTSLAHVADVLPTLLDAAAVTLPTNIEGKSLKPVAQTGTRTGPAAHVGLGFQYDDYIGYRAGDFKIISVEGRTWGLYNLATDPAETHDLSSDPAHATTLAELANAYQDWITIGGTGVRSGGNGGLTLMSADLALATRGAQPVPGNNGTTFFSGNILTWSLASDPDNDPSTLQYFAYWSFRPDLTTADAVLAWSHSISSGWQTNITTNNGIIAKAEIPRGVPIYAYVLVRDAQLNRTAYQPASYTLATSGGVPSPGQISSLTPQEPSSVKVSWTPGTDSEDSTLAYALLVADRPLPSATEAYAYGRWVTPFTDGLTSATARNLPAGTHHFAVLVRDSARNVRITPLASGVPIAAATLAIGAYSTYDDFINRLGNPVELADPSFDANNNGLPNFADYAHGNNPLHQSIRSPLEITNIAPLTFQFSGSRDLQDVQYRVVTNSTLDFSGDRTVIFDSNTDLWFYDSFTELPVADDPGTFIRRFGRLEIVGK